MAYSEKWKRRIASGNCPKHNIPLGQSGQRMLSCPRHDCHFSMKEPPPPSPRRLVAQLIFKTATPTPVQLDAASAAISIAKAFEAQAELRLLKERGTQTLKALKVKE